MKRRFAVPCMVLVLSISASAGEKDKKEKVSGYLVDVMCSSELAEKGAAKHSKECLQMPDCVASGYAVLTTDNKVIKFDAKGTEEAKKVIAASSKDKDFKVTVSGVVEGDSIAVSAIELQ